MASNESFDSWKNRTLFERIPYGRLLGMGGTSFFVILDIFVYPEHTTQLMLWRFSSVGMLLLTAVLDWTKYGKRNPQLTMVLMVWALTIPIIQNALILGPYSPNYYYGVILVLTGAAAIFPLSWRVHLLAQSAILLYYIVANFVTYDTENLLQNGLENIINMLWAISLLDVSIFAYERLFRERWGANLALEDAYQKISEKERMKTTYLLNISDSLQENLDRTIDKAKAGLKLGDASSSGLFESIESSGKELSKMIGDMLDLSRLETGSMHLVLDSAELKSLCEESIEKFKFIMGASNKDIEVKSRYEDNLGMITTDLEQLKNIIKILLNFVLENSRSHKISVQVERIITGDSDGFTISIGSDDLVIPPEERVRAFIPYSKVRGGIGGIQLPIARMLARNLGGDINITGEFNRGASFQIRLPRITVINRMLAGGSTPSQ
ncbi:MAG: sensor histidine kinase [Acidiferrobacterales bacterium]